MCFDLRLPGSDLYEIDKHVHTMKHLPFTTMVSSMLPCWDLRPVAWRRNTSSWSKLAALMIGLDDSLTESLEPPVTSSNNKIRLVLNWLYEWYCTYDYTVLINADPQSSGLVSRADQAHWPVSGIIATGLELQSCVCTLTDSQGTWGWFSLTCILKVPLCSLFILYYTKLAHLDAVQAWMHAHKQNITPVTVVCLKQLKAKNKLVVLVIGTYFNPCSYNKVSEDIYVPPAVLCNQAFWWNISLLHAAPRATSTHVFWVEMYTLPPVLYISSSGKSKVSSKQRKTDVFTVLDGRLEAKEP